VGPLVAKRQEITISPEAQADVDRVADSIRRELLRRAAATGRVDERAIQAAFRSIRPRRAIARGRVDERPILAALRWIRRAPLWSRYQLQPGAIAILGGGGLGADPIFLAPHSAGSYALGVIGGVMVVVGCAKRKAKVRNDTQTAVKETS
jgi:hypothetical protein